ncbi:MAG TPA: hypothetical protein VKH40_12475 [Alloacidobacterium sp.]|nr:hypothetical protein [Alloacidobacterium sp.]
MAALEYLHLDLRRPATLTNAAKIGCPISTNAGNSMALLAPLGMKCDCATLPPFIARCVYNKMMSEGENSD